MNTPKYATGGCCPPPPCSEFYEVACPSCGGNPYVSHDGSDRCLQCWGTGKAAEVQCEACAGDGSVETEHLYRGRRQYVRCEKCDGRGFHVLGERPDTIPNTQGHGLSPVPKDSTSNPASHG
jgi:DnaJ-class molecular chaperone